MKTYGDCNYYSSLHVLPLRKTRREHIKYQRLLNAPDISVMKDKSWLLTYFPVTWLGHVCQGLAMSILGPSQPYLALMVGVSSQKINLIWTMLAIGSCLATIVTGLVFKEYVTRQSFKLLYLSMCVSCCAVFIGLVPWMSSFYTLLLSELNDNSKILLIIHN